MITGAASGIGRSIALALAREGVDLYLLDIDMVRLAAVVAEASALGVEVQSVKCDLGRSEEISAAVRKIVASWERVELLVNNAGVAYYGPTEVMTASQWDWLLRINLLAPIQMTRELLPTLLAQPEAHVLNVCSIAGLVAGRKLAAYHVSKFGLVGFTEALRAEYGSRGLGFTALCPGLVQTRLFEAAQFGQLNRRPPPAWACAAPDAVARKAVQAIRANRGLVLVTAMAHVLWFCKRFCPGLLEFLNRLHRKRRRAPQVSSADQRDKTAA